MSEIVYYDANPTVRDIMTRHLQKYGLSVVNIPRLEETEDVLKQCSHPVVLIVDLSRQPTMLAYLQSVVPRYIKSEERCILTSVQPTALAPYLPRDVDDCFFKHVVERPFKRVDFMNFFDGIVKPYIESSNSIQLEAPQSFMNSSVSQITGVGGPADVEDLAVRVQVDELVESSSLEQPQRDAEKKSNEGDAVRPINRMSRRSGGDGRRVSTTDGYSGAREISGGNRDLPRRDVSGLNRDLPRREGSGLNRELPRREGSGLNRDLPRREGSGLNRDLPRREGSGLNRELPRREGSGLNRELPRREGSGLNREIPDALREFGGHGDSALNGAQPSEPVEFREVNDGLPTITDAEACTESGGKVLDDSCSPADSAENEFSQTAECSAKNPVSSVINPYLRKSSDAQGTAPENSIPAVPPVRADMPKVSLAPVTQPPIPAPVISGDDDSTMIVSALMRSPNIDPSVESPSLVVSGAADNVRDDGVKSAAHFCFQYGAFLEQLRQSLICDTCFMALCQNAQSRLAIFVHAGSVCWIEKIYGDRIMSFDEFMTSIQDDCHIPISQLKMFVEQNMTLTQAFSAVDAEPQIVAICDKYIRSCVSALRDFENGVCTIYEELPPRYRELRDHRPSHDIDIIPMLFEDLRQNQDLIIAPEIFQKVRFCLRSYRTPQNINIKLNRTEQDMLTSLQKPLTIGELRRAGKKHVSDLLYRLVMFEFVDFVK